MRFSPFAMNDISVHSSNCAKGLSMELLAPAGSFECLKAAISAGADSVYFGLNGFNARSKAENYDGDIGDWIDYCHLHGVTAHVAANILIKDSEFDECLAAIVHAFHCGADAFIVQDIGLISTLFELYPEIPVHISTQAGVFSPDGLKFFTPLKNITRVVLARESETAQVKEMAKMIETEIFCHGALCVAFSGNCYLSSYLFGASGNRGKCRQLCRMRYTAAMPNVESNSGYMLSAKDLCLVEKTQILKDIGARSFKVEGRLKRPDYVRAVTSCYRAAFDGKRLSRDTSLLKRAFNRGNFTDGYMYTSDVMYNKVQSSIGERIGIVTAASGKKTQFQAEATVSVGDGCKVLRNSFETGSGIVTSIIKNIGILASEGDIKRGDLVHITNDTKLTEKLFPFEKKLQINMHFTAKLGKPVSLALTFGDMTACVQGIIPQVAKNAPTDTEDIKKQLLKLGGTPFKADITVDADNGIFMNNRDLNDIRRRAIEKLTEDILTFGRRQLAFKPFPMFKPRRNSMPTNAYILPDFDFASKFSGHLIYDPEEMNLEEIEKNAHLAEQMYLYFPYFLRSADIQLMKKCLRYFRGAYCNGAYAVTLARASGKDVFIGDMNLFNRSACEYARRFSDKICLSKELSLAEIKRMNDENVYVQVYGNMRLMQLSHCVVKNCFGGNCNSCLYRSGLTLTDRMNAVFPVKRRKFVNCYFMLYSGVITNAESCDGIENYNKLYDLSAFDRKRLEEFLRGDRLNEKNNCEYLTRGVL